MVEGYHFKHRLRVRYNEVDTKKIVFNSNYLNYLNIAVSEYFCEVLKLDIFELEQSGIIDRVIKKTAIEYNKPAIMYDWLNIWCRTKKMGSTSMSMEFIITRDEEEVLLTAETLYVYYDHKKRAVKPIPNILRQSIERYEHGNN